MDVILSAQNSDLLNTAVLTGEVVSVPVKTLAVEADGSVTDVTNYTSCRSTEEDVIKVSHLTRSPSGVFFLCLIGYPSSERRGLFVSGYILG